MGKRAGTASQTRPSSARAASAGKALPAASLTPWQFDPFTNSTSPATLGDLIIAGDGYASVELELWDPARGLVAYATQVMFFSFPGEG